jgi:type II secretory pathway component PulC
MVLPDPEKTEEEGEKDAPPPVTGSLATAVVRWTMPDTGVLLEDQGKQRVILLDASFDVYTLEEVTYRQAIFKKGEDRVVKDLIYSKAGPATLPSAAPAPPIHGIGQQVVAADPGGTGGKISREIINRLVENPFDELRNIRIRPADGGGVQVQWINRDSIFAQLGVQRGDVIRSINGIHFQNLMDITNSISSLINNDRFDVEMLRNGASTSLQYAVQ